MKNKKTVSRVCRGLVVGTVLAASLVSEVLAHGIGFTNTRVVMDPTSIANLVNRPVPGITPSDHVGFIISVDTVSLSGPMGYFTMYNPVGATVTNAEFVNSAYSNISASSPTAMENGWGARGGPLTFTNWSATTGNGSIAVLNGDTGIFYSTDPRTRVFNPNADGTITTSVLGATIKTTSQLMGVTATHNMWDANQVRAFGAGTANAAANTTSTALVVNTAGTGTTPFKAGSAVAGPDVGYPLDNTGAVGPWNRISYPNSHTTLGVPSAAAAVTVQGALAIVGVPTTAGASFPLPSATNAVRWAIGSPRFPGTYYVRATLNFDATILNSVNGIILDSEATGSDADGSNGGKDNVWRYHQPAATTLAGTNGLYLVKDIVAVNGVASLNPATVPAGAKLTYRIRYLNIGGLPQTGVVLSDTVPAQISTVCASITNVTGSATTASSTCPAAGATVTFNIPARLNVGQGGAVTFDLQTVTGSNLTVLNTTKLVSTQNATGVTAPRSTLFQMPDMTIAKSHVGNFGQGQIGAQYTLTASNVGNFDTAGTITVTDTLPAGLVATAAAGTGWTCAITAPANLITTCTRSDPVAAGASYPPITLTVNVGSTAATPLTNSVTVAGGGETNTANNTATDATTITAKPDLTIGKSHAGNFAQGQTGSAYTLTVNNGGGAATAGTITVTDTLPAGLSYLSAVGTGFVCSAAAQVVTCNRTTALNALATVAITLTVNVAANAATPQVNQASVSGGGELNTSNNTASDSTVVLQAPVVLKAFSPTSIIANSPSLLTITLTNPNPVAMTLGSPAFTDVFPTTPGAMTVANTATSNTCGGTLTNSVGGAIAVGSVGIRLAGGSIAANSSCAVTVHVTALTAGTYVNNTGPVATVGSSTGVSSSASLSVVVPVAPTIAKSFSPNPIENNVPTVLTLTVNNTNAVPISAVAFNDAYPSGILNTATPAAAFTPASVAAGCTGTLTGGAANGNSLGLSGGFIPANATCQITVNVVAAVVSPGYVNTTTAVTTTNNGVTATGLAATSTLVVISPAPPFIAKAFSPAAVGVGGVSRLTLTVTNPNGSRAIVGTAFSDTYPANLVNAPVPNVVSTCGGTLTGGLAGGNFIALSGASIPVNSNCTIAVDVVSAAAGSYVNTSGAVSSTDPLVGTGNTATSTLTVVNKPTVSKAFSPSVVLIDGVATLSLTLTNAAPVALSGVAFTDSFPANLRIAAPNALSNTCGGTVTAAAGTGVLGLASGALAASSSCTVAVAVTSSAAGAYSNTSGGVSSAESGAAGPASNTAVLYVVTKPTISKSFSPTSIPTGGSSTLTLQITNPNGLALTGLAFTDNFPSNLAVAATPGVTSNCGGTLAAVAGATSVNLSSGAVAAAALCTVKVNVTSTVLGDYANTSGGVSSTETGAAGAQSNTATLTVTLPGVSASGFVYSDPNHNIQKDGGEAGTGLALFVKLVPAGGGPALQAVAVNAATGFYQFAAVPAGQYTLVVDNNSTLADVTPTVPSGWFGTEMSDFSRANVLVASVELQNLNFGLFNGSKLSGTVFADTGAGGGVHNDGIQNGGEPGIARVPVRAIDSTGATTYDSVLTDGSGNYTLWIPAAASGTTLIQQAGNGSYLSTGGSAGNTGGSYNRPTDITTVNLSAGTAYSGVNFGDVPVNRFAADGQQSGSPGNVVFYGHRFNAGSGGSLDLSAVSASGWPVVVYRDLNCNGQIDAGDTVLIGAITVVAAEQVCVVNKVSIPAGTGVGLHDLTAVQANFVYTNANPGVTAALYVTDTTTAGAGATGLALTKTVDKATAFPGETIFYTLSYQNNSNTPLGTIVISDATPAFTTFVSAACSLPLPVTISACNVTTASASVGGTSIQWGLTGSLGPAAAGQVVFAVKVNN
jgi:uncharacterized repeat protein (TIGR01451 family)